MVHKGVKRSLVAVAAISFLALTTACTNAEGSPPTASGNEAKSGQSGQELAQGVQPDSTVQELVPAAIKGKGSLTLVTDPTYAPIDFTDEQGKIVGLEPDMALAVAKKMGLTIAIEKADFNGILAGIEARRYDASWAAFSITEERKDKVNMVSYMRGGTSVMVRKGNPLGIQSEMDLCGKTVAAQTGTTQALNVLPAFEKKCADAGKDKPVSLLLPQQDNVNQSVAAGRAQALVADNALTGYYAQLQPDAFTSVDSILVEPSLSGVVSPKDDGGLSKTFQAAIQSLMDDGTYAKIMESWNLKSGILNKSEVNPSVGS
ncbi:polar amino acid transport system substrate-binding protein [Arthrobacter sp. V4I6]|uniref:transporter substrate-binding domain-containing protein n=1 Tax=unclassified Arthrobacter TaxID=235627 RepID=UPI002787688D|nr:MULTISPECIES: transporter substrate-binding domain-containing protein [unclassified Arthrobacter]MDQ0819537.1 polar amino acid transport system substrate-binding protein [Arthrobacter sp. V1I7]MDQ0853719.1 polar amino acid transport system substrate-binding protein [Arthrobacter sp. V4I6]